MPLAKCLVYSRYYHLHYIVSYKAFLYLYIYDDFFYSPASVISVSCLLLLLDGTLR